MILLFYDNDRKNPYQPGPSGFDLWFTWCQTCRHGGHAIHILQWFEKHKICPVSECNCQCSMHDKKDDEKYGI